MKLPPDMRAAALWYAAQGVPVLPLHYPVPIRVSDFICSCGSKSCSSPAKHPYGRLVKNGLDDASTDPATIGEWWRQVPSANIGLRTGAVFDALDVDGPRGEQSYKELTAALGGELHALAVVRTPREGGGRHLYLQPPHARNLAGGRAGVPEGLDVRGEGGYVVAVPSQGITGRRYTWTARWGEGQPGFRWEAAHELLTRGQANGDAPTPVEFFPPLPAPLAPADTRYGTAYGMRALELECARVQATHEGGRNDALNTSAMRVGQLADAGHLDRSHAEAALADAARLTGLEEREIRRTIESGFKGAGRKPRVGVPDPTQRPQAGALGSLATTMAAVAHPATHIEEDWDAPSDRGQAAPPIFPVHVLGPLARPCEALAEFLQVPVDMVGMLTLAATAAVVRGRVFMRHNPRWVEPLNLYVAVVAGVGERKSPALSPIVAPLRDIEREMREAIAPRIDQAEQARRIQENRLRIAELNAGKAKGSDQLVAEEYAREEARKLADIEVPAMPQLLAGDMTPEALVSLLAEQGGALASMSAEGGLFDNLVGGRYSGGLANLDAILQAHDGREPIIVNRKHGRSLRVERPCLTLGLAIQPRVLERLGRDEDATGRGLFARFLYSVPESRVGSRIIRTNPDEESIGTFVTVLRGLDDWLSDGDKSARSARTEGSGTIAPFPYKFVRQSYITDSIYNEYREELEERRHPDSGDGQGILAWLSKLDGQVLRLAGLLQLLYATPARRRDSATTPSSGTSGTFDTAGSLDLSREAMTGACQLADYLIEHCKRATLLVDGHGPEGPAAPRQLLAWAKDRADEHGEFSIRDAHRGLHGRVIFHEVQAVHRAAQELAQSGHIRLLQQESKPGRPSSPRYRLHPQYRKGNQGA